MFDDIRRAVIEETSVYFWITRKSLSTFETILKYLPARFLVEIQGIGIYHILSYMEAESYQITRSSPDIDKSIIRKKTQSYRKILIRSATCFDREEEFSVIIEMKTEDEVGINTGFSEGGRVEGTTMDGTEIKCIIEIGLKRSGTFITVIEITDIF